MYIKPIAPFLDKLAKICIILEKKYKFQNYLELLILYNMCIS